MTEAKPKTSNAIGIDLGTTFSCVAGYLNGKIEIITNPEGERTTPSVVSFGENNNIVVGTPAKNMFGVDPSLVIYDAKRMIGRGFDDDNIQKAIKRWPFNVVRYNAVTKSEDNTPCYDQGTIDNIKIKVCVDGKVHYYDPIEISARVLTYLKNAAEARLGCSVEAAVVTVPAYFSEPQKQRTKVAAEIAGFKTDKVRLLAEPTAAAMAYGHIRSQSSQATNKTENILVFDLGGGTFDVSVLEFVFSDTDGPMGIVKATDGDTFLGGVDFDNLLINHTVSEFLKKNPSVKECDIKENAMLRLRAECNRIKAALSSTTSSSIYVPCFYQTTDLNVQITRAKFELLCNPLFKRCLERVKGCLLLSQDIKNVDYSKDGNTLILTDKLRNQLEDAKRSIDSVILVGGSSRIPKVRGMLSEYFGSSKVTEPVNADEAVAYGAAYQAASIYSDVVSAGQGLLLVDCIPLDLSIETAGGVSTVLIPRNSNIPIKKTETFTTYDDNQPAVTINVYEGNRLMVADNNKIGSFNLDGITKAPKGTPKIDVTFDIDHNGVLHVTAVDQKTTRKADLTVCNTQSRLSDEEIQRMRKMAEEHAKQDEELKQKVTKKNSLEQTINSVKSLVAESQMDQGQKDNLLNELKEHDEWVHSCDLQTVNSEEFERRTKVVQEMIQKISQSGAASSAGPSVEEVN